MSLRPKILLAFANTVHAERHLSALKEERDGIRAALLENPYCEEMELTEARLKQVEQKFKKYQRDIVAFHFAGHAEGEQIEMTHAEGTLTRAFAQGLAGYIQKHGHVKLVFLNACATQEQARLFHRLGVDIVIATHRPINDVVAKDFAVQFYSNLASGQSIQDAFDDAILQLQGRHQVEDFYRHRERDLVRMAKDGLRPAEPYLLSVAQDTPEAVHETLQSWYEAYNAQFDESPSEPVGAYAYLLCNRTKARNQFYDQLEAQLDRAKFRPQSFLIHGGADELPHSLNDRFKRFTIKDLLQGTFEAPYTREWTIELPRKEDFLHPDPNMPRLRRNQFLRRVFKLKTEEVPASLVVKRFSNQIQVAFLQHNLMAENWHPKMKAFLMTYMQEFGALELKEQGPKVILLFNIIYPPAANWMGFKGKPERTIGPVLHQLAAEVDSCTLIEKLPSVPRADVQSWQIEHLKTENSLTQELYGKKKNLSMQVVEQELKHAIQRHNQRL